MFDDANKIELVELGILVNEETDGYQMLKNAVNSNIDDGTACVIEKFILNELISLYLEQE